MKAAAPILILILTASCACDGREGNGKSRSSHQSPSSSKRYPEGARNRLIYEKSPYLRQHADNPVDWYPWGPEAFETARREDKPIFLSIGYSTCHWCHVMERESFMDEEVAQLLRENFISVKVDREERPDVDQIYMTACQIMTGGGGWPLSAWLTPEKEPFFVGTYYPPEDRFQRPGFKSLLRKIAEAWKNRRADLLKDAKRTTEAIRNSSDAPQGDLGPQLLDSGMKSFAEGFDGTYGGFEGRNKFPRSIVHEFLLRYQKRSGEPKALEMVEKTLRAMRNGGMYDQLGSGFHRYSTDQRWLVPHFEKMLYDQALLIRAYVQAYQVTGREEYAATARETAEYVLRDLTSPQGAFYSAEDADSDLPDGKGHAEGAFYVWTPAQVKSAVPGKEGEILCRAFGVVEGGNFEPIEKDEPRGNSVVHVAVDIPVLAKEFERTESEIRRILREGAKTLLAARSKRPRPHLDDKILADWNGLMIGALGFAGAVLEEPRYVAAAEQAARFLLQTMRRDDGHWLHRSSKDGGAGIEGFLDDYAFLAEGFFLLHQATFRLEYLQAAVRTAEVMIEEFADPAGGFYHTGKSAENLIARMKEAYDGALPSGNSVAALTLVRLGDLCSRDDFLERAGKVLAHFAGTIARHEASYPYHLCAVDAVVGPRQEIVIVGNDSASETADMLRLVRRCYLPNAVLALVPPDGLSEQLKKFIPMAADRPTIGGKPTAYVCENYSCKAPTSSLEKLGALLERR